MIDGGAADDAEGPDLDEVLQAVADGRLEEYWQDRDVRNVLPEQRARDLLTPDAVPWHRYHHAYGPADDVPALLHSLADPDVTLASRSLSELWNNVRHQGGTSPPAALAVPFLIRIAADPAAHNRSRLLLLAAEAGHRNHFGRDRREDLLQVEEPPEDLRFDVSGYPVWWTYQAAREAIAADTRLLVTLLDDTDPAVRASAAYALATAKAAPPHMAEALRARLAVENDEPVRISLVLALAQLAIERGEVAMAVAWAEPLWTVEANPIDLRFAAALAWLCASTAPTPQPLLDLLAAAATPAMQQWMERVPWPDDIAGHGGLAAWLVTFLGDEPAAQAQLAARLTPTPHSTITESALSAAYDVASTWRSQAPEMLDLLADQLGNADPVVSRAAARHLSAAGMLPDPVTDRLYEVLERDDDEARAWAVLALAHSGDPRAVLPLAELLSQHAFPWPNPHPWVHPMHRPQRLIHGLTAHADRLLPAVLHRLADPAPGDWRSLRYDLLVGLQHWGEQARGAVAVLTTLLSQSERDRKTVTTILGRIGPAAGAAVPALDALAAQAAPKDLGVLVWARWRITGEHTEATAATLAELATIPPHGPLSLRLLAGLGPAAAPHEPTIRAALANNYFWVRAEAAHALWRATGNTTDSLPVLLDIFRDRPDQSTFQLVHATIAGYLTDIGPAAHAATPVLTDFVNTDHRASGYPPPLHDPISWDQHCQNLATAALRSIHR